MAKYPGKRRCFLSMLVITVTFVAITSVFHLQPHPQTPIQSHTFEHSTRKLFHNTTGHRRHANRRTPSSIHNVSHTIVVGGNRHRKTQPEREMPTSGQSKQRPVILRSTKLATEDHSLQNFVWTWPKASSLEQSTQKVVHSQRTNTSTLQPSEDNAPTPSSQIPQHKLYNDSCSDRLCFQYLTISDMRNVTKCLVDINHKLKDTENILNLTDPMMAKFWPGNCHFMDGRNRAAVALTSFPGSGNTWVRGLLEQATGICTGSIYCDFGLRMSGMHGEGIQSGSVLVVKDHHNEWRHYQSAVLIIRNPLNALVSEYNRKMGKGKHTGTIDGTFFRSNKMWDVFVSRFSKKWQQFIVNIVLHRPEGRSLLVVRYEDILTDRLAEMTRLLTFLEVPYTEEVLAMRMNQDYMKFRRHGENFEHFTPSQRQRVTKVVSDCVHLLRQNHGKTYGIDEYLY